MIVLYRKNSGFYLLFCLFLTEFETPDFCFVYHGMVWNIVTVILLKELGVTRYKKDTKSILQEIILVYICSLLK